MPLSPLINVTTKNGNNIIAIADNKSILIFLRNNIIVTSTNSNTYLIR